MPEPPVKPFSGIFVSYRRDDSSGHAGRLFDRLVDHFGKDRIFMDIDTIEPGEDFVTVIENAVSSCDILIAMIGRNWLSSAGRSTGRLDNPNDFVRLEITTALNRDIRVIPVLVQRASMPKPQDLPHDLANLARRNAVELSDLRWQSDVSQLITILEKILLKREEERRRTEQEAADRRRREEETRKLEEARRREAREQEAAESARRTAAERQRREAEERFAREAEKARSRRLAEEPRLTRAQGQLRVSESEKGDKQFAPSKEQVPQSTALPIQSELKVTETQTHSVHGLTIQNSGEPAAEAPPSTPLEQESKEAEKPLRKGRNRWVVFWAGIMLASFILIALSSSRNRTSLPYNETSNETSYSTTNSNTNSSPAASPTPSVYPNVIRLENGDLRPAPGYRWLNPDNSKDFRVELKPGLVEAEGGALRPAKGYRWANPDDPKDMAVQLKEGLVRSEDGKLSPAPGYRWVNRDDPNDFSVEKIP